MALYLVTTHQAVAMPDEQTEGTPAPRQSDLSAVRRQIEFVRRTLANGYLDFDTLDECEESLGRHHPPGLARARLG